MISKFSIIVEGPVRLRIFDSNVAHGDPCSCDSNDEYGKAIKTLLEKWRIEGGAKIFAEKMSVFFVNNCAWETDEGKMVSFSIFVHP